MKGYKGKAIYAGSELHWNLLARMTYGCTEYYGSPLYKGLLTFSSTKN